VGVHQDGLVHVSQLADHFVRDPADVVRVGQKVRVTVLGVDLERRRIALTMKRAEGGTPAGPDASSSAGHGSPAKRTRRGKGRGQGRNRETASGSRPVPETPPTPKGGTIAPNGMRFR